MTNECICGKECKATEHDYEPIDVLEIDCSVHGVQPTACMQCCFEAHRNGVDAERARIVAWLREGAAGKRGSKVPEWIPLAYRIEHGEHHGNEVDSRKAYEEWDETCQTRLRKAHTMSTERKDEFEDYNRAAFTERHPKTHPDDCNCNFDAGRKCPECYENGLREYIALRERDAVIAELDRMLAVCEYEEVRAFIPLLQNHLRQGRHHV